jgi:hypothetical protein
VLLLQDEEVEALEYYRNNIPSFLTLTSHEYFRLGTTAIARVNPSMTDEIKNLLRQEGLDLLYQSYQQNKADRNDAKNLIVKLLLKEGGVDISESDKVEEKFQEFLTLRQQKLALKVFEMHLAKLEAFRFIRSKQLTDNSIQGHQSSNPPRASFFSKSTTPINPELSCVDTIISNLKKGRSLSKQLEDPNIQKYLNDFPLLAALIKEELGVTVTPTHNPSLDVTVTLNDDLKETKSSEPALPSNVVPRS